ncbi:MAG: SRPBCC family protein [Planctomycetota bacterium]|nr:SRPBCC family protein [Planctomycetota bacterium]
MPSASVTIDIHVGPEVIFDLIHDYSRRLDWDPFLREARLLNGAHFADRGVSSRCVARWAVGGLAMDTVYVSFTRPRVAAVNMTNGPLFLRSFAASIRQERIDNKATRVTYRYNFESQPSWLAFVTEPIVGWVFYRETCRRLAALKRFLEAGQPTSEDSQPVSL